VRSNLSKELQEGSERLALVLKLELKLKLKLKPELKRICQFPPEQCIATEQS